MKLTPFVEYLIYDVLDESLHITARAMMGAHILYNEGKVFAIAEDDRLWFKGNKELQDWYMSRGSKKFSYMKEGKKQEMNYFLVPEEVIENKEELDVWLDVALSIATKPKKKK
jgi:DNA transformation protein